MHDGSLPRPQAVAPRAASVRRCSRPIQPRPSSTGHTPVASTTAETRLVERYQSRNTKAPELTFRALLISDGARDVSFRRVLAGYP